jgi:hypothetical protein
MGREIVSRHFLIPKYKKIESNSPRKTRTAEVDDFICKKAKVIINSLTYYTCCHNRQQQVDEYSGRRMFGSTSLRVDKFSLHHKSDIFSEFFSQKSGQISVNLVVRAKESRYANITQLSR